MKKIYPILFLAISALIGCNNNIAPDFSYSPEAPKAGQSVTFTNTTTEGEVWNWTFGDGGTSTTKSPTKIYKAPGIYDVTLRVDSNDHYITTKQIIIYDTIPSIYTETEDVYYYEPITLSIIAYNPYSYDITYEWQFSDNAVGDNISNNIATTENVTLFFSKYGQDEEVKVKVTLGDSIYNITRTFHVQDVKSRSLLMAEPNGHILRQRIYENGTEPYTVLPIAAGRCPNNIKANDNQLYIFNADTLAGSAITVSNLSDNNTETFISHTNANVHGGFFNGYVRNNYVYWTNIDDYVYRANNTVRNEQFTWISADNHNTYYITDATAMSLPTGLPAGGISYYDGTYLWGKNATGKGIVRFKDDAAQTPLNSILTDFSIQAFEIDELNLKIYFSVPESESNKGLWVSDIAGNKPVQISENSSTGIAIDNQSDKVYWSTGSNVMCCQLTKSINNTINRETISIFTENTNVTGLTIDRVTK